MALAIHLDRPFHEGSANNYADIARLGHECQVKTIQ